VARVALSRRQERPAQPPGVPYDRAMLEGPTRGPIRQVPVAGPWITERERAYVADAVETNWYDRAGDYTGRFETAFATATGRRHAVSLPSCTSGLHLALAALGVRAGDEVILPDLTWIASSAPVTYVGADPVFVDVDPSTWCLSAEALRAAITPRTKAIVAVDLYGGMPDYAQVMQVADDAGVPVIEDAAESVGSMMSGVPAGGFGLASVFSFHGSKTLTTGEGGMLVTDDDALYARIQVLRDHGRPPGDQSFFNGEIAFKYKMSSMQAALGLAQLERLDELVARKRAIFAWYQEAFDGVEGVTLNAEPAGTHNSYWMVTAVLHPGLRLAGAELGAVLKEQGIATRPFFHPLSSLPAYATSPSSGGAEARNPVAYDTAPRGINLPSALTLTRDDVDYVTSAALAALRGTRQANAS
jgi:perosamine synthetase